MTALLVLAIDQLTKAGIRAALDLNESLTIIPGVFDLARIQNTGAAFGMLPGRRELFIAVSMLMLVGVAIYWVRERPTEWPVVIALGLVVGGAVGNLIDRALVGRVTDFLAFSFFSPVFNIADSAIVVGVGALIVWMFFGPTADSDAQSADGASELDRGQDSADPIVEIGVEPPR